MATDDVTEAAAQSWTQNKPSKPGAYLYTFGSGAPQLLWLFYSKRSSKWHMSQGGLPLDPVSYFQEVVWWLGPLEIPEIPE